MPIQATHDLQADVIDIKLCDFPDSAGVVKETVEVDPYRQIDLDESGKAILLYVFSPSKPGNLQLDKIANTYGFKDRLADVYRAIAETYAQEQRIAA